MYKIIVTVMIHNGFEAGFLLRRCFKRTVEPIQVPSKGESYGVRYVFTDDEVKMKNSGD